MAINESITIPGHYNIYTGNFKRDLRIDFCLPENGTNEKTGILLFVPGFSGHIDSKIYIKMRNYFSDKYNLVTVQCNYFGSKYMQTAHNVKLKGDFSNIVHYFNEAELQEIYKDNSKALAFLRTRDSFIKVHAVLDETAEEFADLGFMQAIDIITAVEAIKIVLKENKLEYDTSKIIGSGHSQGAYLLSLANRLVPFLFSEVVDNSGWLRPQFFYRSRFLFDYDMKLRREIEFSYYGKDNLKDLEALNLNNVFKDFKNGAYMHIFLGETDYLVGVEEKKTCYKNFEFIDFEVITPNKVDGEIIKSTNHGLDADFLKLLELVLNKEVNHKNPNSKIENYEMKISKTKISVDYSNGLPLFNFNFIV